MNKVQLAEQSTVAAFTRLRGPMVTHVLRCFECDWGMTVDTWAAALNTAIGHEREHGKGKFGQKAAR